MSAGLAIVLTHSVWVASWPVLITILGWLMTIGGAARIVCPHSTEKPSGDAMLQEQDGADIARRVWLVLGASSPSSAISTNPRFTNSRSTNSPALEREQAQK